MTDQTHLPILITGASRGLGAALAEELSLKASVIVVARTVGGLEDLDDRIQAKGGAATLAPLDVTDTGAMGHLCRSIYDRWGGLSLWVHTAIHAAPLTPADHIAEGDWTKSIKINATATAQLIGMVAPLLGKTGAAWFFDDTGAKAKFFGSYGASKAAQIALAENWQREAGGIGPKVQILTPSPMPTATRARFYPGEDRASLTSCAGEAARLVAEYL